MDEPVWLVGFTLNVQPYFRPMATLLPARGHTPILDASVWLAPNATVIGEVHMGAESTVWCSAVVRGDGAPIKSDDG